MFMRGNTQPSGNGESAIAYVDPATGALRTTSPTGDVSKGSGVVDAGTQRVVLASNGPTVTALGAPSDAEVASGDASMIALLKRLRSLLDGSTITSQAFTFAGGSASVSDGFDLTGKAILRLLIPSTWVTATRIGFQTSPDSGTTWYTLYDQYGVEYTAEVGASRIIAMDPSIFVAMRLIRLRSLSSANALVVQTGSAVVSATIKAL